jgi:hypothetical protein
VGFCNRNDDVEDLPRAFLVDDGKVEFRTAGVFGLLIFAAEFAGEQATCKRAPDQEAGSFGFEERNNFALEIAACDGVVSLKGLEARNVAKLGNGESFGDLPGLPVGDADVADFAGAD